MTMSKTAKIGKVTTTITITNQIDQTLAKRGFIPVEQKNSEFRIIFDNYWS
ncbi:hypothetical protein NSTC745_01085 [Nostoc sp. DSM 114161]|jgi:predicted component of type VI protein secretion system